MKLFITFSHFSDVVARQAASKLRFLQDYARVVQEAKTDESLSWLLLRDGNVEECCSVKGQQRDLDPYWQHRFYQLVTPSGQNGCWIRGNFSVPEVFALWLGWRAQFRVDEEGNYYWDKATLDPNPFAKCSHPLQQKLHHAVMEALPLQIVLAQQAVWHCDCGFGDLLIDNGVLLDNPDYLCNGLPGVAVGLLLKLLTQGVLPNADSFLWRWAGRYGVCGFQPHAGASLRPLADGDIFIFATQSEALSLKNGAARAAEVKFIIAEEALSLHQACLSEALSPTLREKVRNCVFQEAECQAVLRAIGTRQQPEPCYLSWMQTHCGGYRSWFRWQHFFHGRAGFRRAEMLRAALLDGRLSQWQKAQTLLVVLRASGYRRHSLSRYLYWALVEPSQPFARIVAYSDADFRQLKEAWLRQFADHLQAYASPEPTAPDGSLTAPARPPSLWQSAC